MKLSLLFGAFVAALAATFVAFFHLGPALPFVIAGALCIFVLFRMTLPRRSFATAFVVAFVLAPSFAFAATIDVGQAVGGSLIDIFNGAVAAGITALVAWVAMVIKNKFNIEIEAQHRAALTAFLQRQASSLVAKGAVKLQGLKIEVSSDAVAVAANTALNAIPDALKFFGLTPEALQKRIIDLLPQQPAVAQAQAIALDEHNPATSSKPAA